MVKDNKNKLHFALLDNILLLSQTNRCSKEKLPIEQQTLLYFLCRTIVPEFILEKVPYTAPHFIFLYRLFPEPRIPPFAN